MKILKIFKKISVLAIAVMVSSCNYLDVVPDDKPTLEDAFKNENEAQKALYGLYNGIPDLFFFQDSPIFVGTNELVTSKLGATHWYPYKAIIYEEYSINNPWFNFWSNKSSRITYDFYARIRKCYEFKNRLKLVHGMTEENRKRWTGEADFLIAYYHHILLQFYGPIILVEEEIPVNLPEDQLLVMRSPYDKCVDFICNKLDEAAANLPATVEQNELGRVTSLVAMGIKARVLLTAASPLFNGNSEFYADFKNPNGEQLISIAYDAQKWAKALAAAKESIELADAHQVKLYYETRTTSTVPAEQAALNYSYAFVEKFNSEVIWGLTHNGGVSNNQRYMIPKVTNSGNARPLGNIAPTMTLVSEYYTKNGLPLDVDPATKGKNLWTYSATDNTALINLEREPRFYASIGYDGGKYSFGTTNITINALAGAQQGYQAGVEYYSSSGYFGKKWVHPKTSYTASTNQFNPVRYAFPELRLAELYLAYAEADFELDGQLSNEGMEYLNKIRTRAGIPTVQDSWALVGGVPNGEKMRELIRRERLIETAMETKRYFDLRRWKIAHIELNKPEYAWNVYGTTKSTFYQRVVMDESGKRGFTSPRNYLLPIHIQDVNTNKNLVQNPGW